MNHGHLLKVLGMALSALAVIERGWFWILFWLGLNFLTLGMAHSFGMPGILGKRRNGQLAWWSWLVFLPLHLATRVVWYAIRMFSREPACSRVDDDLVIGRRLLSSEVTETFDNWVDLTAEFSEPESIRESRSYVCVPILDGGAIPPGALREALDGLRPGKTFIHCAQGHGRTAVFALAFLLHKRRVNSVEEGFRLLSRARPGIQLSSVQRGCIQNYISSSL